MMSVDGMRPEARDKIFNCLHDVEQRYGVKPIVGQFAEHQFFRPDFVGGLLSPVVQMLQLLLVGIGAVFISRRHALGQNGDAYVVAFADKTCHGAATTENLVVRMSGDYQDRVRSGHRSSPPSSPIFRSGTRRVAQSAEPAAARIRRGDLRYRKLCFASDSGLSRQWPSGRGSSG